MPSTTSVKPRRRMRSIVFCSDSPTLLLFAKEKGKDTPAMKRKSGKIRS